MALKISVIPVTPFMENLRILIDESNHEAVVCDPGDAAAEVNAALGSADITLKAIILTHGHLDHTGGVAKLHELSGAPVIGPAAEDDFLIMGIKSQSQMLGLDECKSFTTRYVKDGEELRLFSDPKLNFEVIATPGHTPGAVCFYCESEGFILTGDTLFQGSIGRSDFPGGDYDTLIASVKKLLELPEDTKVLPGHGPDSTIGWERSHNPFVR